VSEWRSSAFWFSDIEDAVDRIVNDVMAYPPSCRADFYRDVITELHRLAIDNDTDKGGDKP
jgi:hypothetical protein